VRGKRLNVLDSLIAIDKQAFLLVNHALAHPWIGYFFDVVTRLGEGWNAGLLTACFLALYDRRAFSRHFPLIVLSMIIGGSVNSLFKDIFDRPRPLKEFSHMIKSGAEWVNVVGPALMSRSFPSGHSQTAFAVVAYLVLLYKSRVIRLAVISLGCLVGLSRLAVGAHFPLDVLGGACVGSAVSAIIWFAWKKIEPEAPKTGSKTGPAANSAESSG
jgi:undecaprenyl-diphosphatase